MPSKSGNKTQKTAPSSSTPSPSSDTSLALSELHLRREQLEREKQWLLKQITRKQKELSNFVEQMREIATEIFQGSRPYVEKISQLSQEVHQFFEDIISGRKMGKQTKQKVQEVYETLLETGVIFSPEDDDSDELDDLFDEDSDDEYEEDFDNEYRRSTPYEPSENPETTFDKKEDVRHIRQTFLRLAEVFHPDKVTEEETKKRHTEIMKELNQAYRAKDFAKLLELEKQHLEDQDVDGEKEDEMTRHCRLLERENQVLRQQYEALLEELKLVKRTPEGEMVTDYRRAKREEIDPIEMALKELERQQEILSEIHQFVKDFRDKKITVKEFLKGPQGLLKSQREYLEDLMEAYLEELFELND